VILSNRYNEIGTKGVHVIVTITRATMKSDIIQCYSVNLSKEFLFKTINYSERPAKSICKLAVSQPVNLRARVGNGALENSSAKQGLDKIHNYRNNRDIIHKDDMI